MCLKHTLPDVARGLAQNCFPAGSFLQILDAATGMLSAAAVLTFSDAEAVMPASCVKLLAATPSPTKLPAGRRARVAFHTERQTPCRPFTAKM